MRRSVTTLYRHPVKGLSPQRLDSVVLTPGLPVPGDRRFAIAHGDADLDPVAPRWLSKRAFMALHAMPALASLTTDWDEAGGELEIRRRGQLLLRADLRDPAGRAALEAFFHDFAGRDARGRPCLVEAADFAFTDVDAPLVSIACSASLRDLERAAGVAIDVRRFRANIVVEGGLPWQELDWVGQEIEIGGARLRVVEPIVRCAATCANPASGESDLNIPRLLVRLRGEPVFAVYAEVLAGGVVRAGDGVIAPEGGALGTHDLGV